MYMNISVIGAGYVGLITGACLAKLGNQVTFIDSDKEKIEAIKKGECPIFEEGLEDILRTARLDARSDIGNAIKSSEISFVCVGTDPGDGSYSIDLRSVSEVAEAIGEASNDQCLTVIKSTVTPGTTEEVIIPLLEKNGRKAGVDFGVCVNPEFLREGFAVEDFLNPDRIVIGEINKQSGDILADLYKGFGCPILRFDLRTAEAIKYASNAFLAAKISFINEIGNICKELSIDTYEVARGMGYDPRIGDRFLNAGIGFGGSCLPKDLRALIGKATSLGYRPGLLEQVLDINETQHLRVIQLLKKYIPDLRGKTIGVLGLAFKSGTDDVRESKAIRVVDALLKEGARVKAYDPAAMDKFRKLFPEITYGDAKTVLACDAILILTDWQEFASLDYAGKIVIDGKRILKARQAKIYEGVCW
jgi:UDPglucose 6-dehydrogenase